MNAKKATVKIVKSAPKKSISLPKAKVEPKVPRIRALTATARHRMEKKGRATKK